MLALRGMKDLKYPRTKLLDILKKNSEKHVKEFREAEMVYRKAVAKAAKRLAVAAENLDNVKDVPMEKLWSTYQTTLKELNGIRLPVNHRSHYDRAYAMFELATDVEIELDQAVFSQLVLDEWDWKDDFSHSLSSNSAYLGQ